MRYRWIFNLLATFSCLTGFAAMGCSGYVPKTKLLNAPSGVIYQVTEQEALDLVYWALQEALPEQKIYRLSEPRVGLFVHEKSQPGGDARYAVYKETTYVYEVGILRVQGTGPQGDQVSGYTYAVKGQGVLKTGPETLAEVEKQVKATFERTGRAVAVTDVSRQKPGPPVISSPIPAPQEAVEAPAAKAPAPSMTDPSMTDEQPAPDDDAFEKLKKLKELLDRGIISQEEFESKKKELLERI